MLLEAKQSQLVLVDYQVQLMPALFESENVLANAQRLSKIARLLNVPIWATEHNPSSLGTTVPELKSLILPNKILSKQHFNACEEGLDAWLRKTEENVLKGSARSVPKHLRKPEEAAPTKDSIVLAGCEAHICLLQTALGLLEEEFEVWVVSDACTSRSERNRDAAFDRLVGAGAELVSTEMVAFEWLKTSQHPQFKAVLEIIKN